MRVAVQLERIQRELHSELLQNCFHERHQPERGLSMRGEVRVQQGKQNVRDQMRAGREQHGNQPEFLGLQMQAQVQLGELERDLPALLSVHESVRGAGRRRQEVQLLRRGRELLLGAAERGVPAQLRGPREQPRRAGQHLGVQVPTRLPLEPEHPGLRAHVRQRHERQRRSQRHGVRVQGGLQVDGRQHLPAHSPLVILETNIQSLSYSLLNRIFLVLALLRSKDN